MPSIKKPPFTYSYRSPLVRRVAGLLDGSVALWPLGGMGKKARPVPASVAVVKLDHLGDAFLFLPTLVAMHRAWPGARISVLCQGGAAEIFRHSGLPLEIVPMAGDGRRTGILRLLHQTVFIFRTLRRWKPDLLLDPRGDARTAVAGFLARVPWRVGRTGREVFSSLHHERYAPAAGTHETESHRVLLGCLRIPPPKTWRPTLDLAGAGRTGKFRKVLAVHASAGYPYKVWPGDSFAEALGAFLNKGKAWRVDLLGASSDRDTLAAIRETLPRAVRPRVEILAGKLTIPETWGHLKGCDLFLGCDSVLAHFAAAQGLPGVVLMNAAVDASAWSPLSRKIKVFHGRDVSHACGLEHCPPPCPHMSAIEPGAVVRALLAPS